MFEGKIMTVTGPVDPEEISAMVTHEHVVHTFGDPPTAEPVYDRAHVDTIALPALNRLLDEGCNAIVECTTEYFGRAVEILKNLSENSGVRIITNTGYYGAAEDRYVPKHAFYEAPQQLADRWTLEWEHGIDGTGVRPGFVKIGVDSPGPLSEIDAKLVRAAAITHRQTGLVVEVHSPEDGSLGREELSIFADEGISPNAWIWVHADTIHDVDAVVDAAGEGGFVEFDGIKPGNIEARVELLSRMKSEGLLSRVLLSHDESTYAADRTESVPVHVTVFTHLIPLLQENGFTRQEIDLMITDNPRKAFAVGVRSL